MIHLQEKFTPEVIEELKSLVGIHIAEVGPFQFDFDVDWERYVSMEEAGIVRLFTMRNDNMLVGYAVYIIGSHTHFASTMFANADALYVLPTHRGHGAGTNFIAFCESMLSDCDAIIQAITPELDYSDTLLKNGYVPLENLYVKKLGRVN